MINNILLSLLLCMYLVRYKYRMRGNVVFMLIK